MSRVATSSTHVAIACGGTGGHLFPGLAVADQLVARGAAVSLLVSPKEVDQTAVRGLRHVAVHTLPAVALQQGSRLAFCRGFIQSWRAARRLFQTTRPAAVLAMGGFTAAPPILAGRRQRAKTFLHESNTIPGRANRWLARVVDQAFVGFPEAAGRLATRRVALTGTPVRSDFQGRDSAECRVALGLAPNRPVLLVMGGSQGARGVNDLILNALPVLARHAQQWQWLHLTGASDTARVEQAYAQHRLRAVVHPFLAEMELALGAATAAVSRAGASSLAEIAAVRLPTLLVPLPTAADNHQWHNAQAFVTTGAAQIMEQAAAHPAAVEAALRQLMEDATLRQQIKTALAPWHVADAASRIATEIFLALGIAEKAVPVSSATEALGAVKFPVAVAGWLGATGLAYLLNPGGPI